VFKVAIVFITSTGTVLIIFMPKLWFVITDTSSASATKDHNKLVIDHVDFNMMYNQSSSPRASFYRSMHGDRPRSYNSSSRLGNLTPTHAGSARRFRPSLETPRVSLAELESVTAGTLMTNGDAFFKVMEDPALRDELRSRLSQRLRAEGLDFVCAVVERNRTVDRAERIAATKRVIRRFLLPEADDQINLSTQMNSAIYDACFAADEAAMCADDLFRGPVLESCKEILQSREFSEFVVEHQFRFRESTGGSAAKASQL